MQGFLALFMISSRKACKTQVVDLYHFISGYERGAFMGCRGCSMGTDGDESDFDERNCLDRWNFSSFVFSHYKLDKEKYKNWQMRISRNCNSQEEAFDKFYELFDEFLEENK